MLLNSQQIIRMRTEFVALFTTVLIRDVLEIQLNVNGCSFQAKGD